MPTTKNYNDYDLKSILLSKDTLNLIMNEKRLILLALIKSDFVIKEAYRINCEGNHSITLNAYTQLFQKHYSGGLKNLKNLVLQQLLVIDTKKGKIIKIRK